MIVHHVIPGRCLIHTRVWHYPGWSAERSLVIFPFFKQCNPLKINLQNFEIDKKKIQDLNLKQSYSSQLNLIKFFFANTWIGLLFLFQLWHFKNIFYSKFWNCFNIFFHTWIWSQIFFQTLDYDCYFLQFWHFKNIFYSKFWNCFNIFFQTDIFIYKKVCKHSFTINSSNKDKHVRTWRTFLIM